MKIFKITVIAAVACFGFHTVNAQHQEAAKKESPKQETKAASETKGNGNAEAMRRNLNYPNATNPADHNQPPYDKGTGRVESGHSKDNLGNSYTRKALEQKK